MLTYIIIGAVVLVGVLLYTRQKSKSAAKEKAQIEAARQERIDRPSAPAGESTFPSLAGPNRNVPDIQPPEASVAPCIEQLLVDGVAMTPANPYFTKKAGTAITLTVEGCALPPEMEKRARDAIRVDNKPSPKEGTPEVTLAVKKRTGRQPDGTTLPGLPANIPSAGSEHLTLSSSQSGLEPRRAWAIQAQGPALIKVAALVWESLRPTMKFTPVVSGTKEYPAYISVTFQPGRANLDGTPTIAGRIFVE